MKAFVGELIGTFVLTLFGCGSVAVAVLFGEYGSIFQIALVWGIGVTLAIYLTRHLSCAHLNPAVTVAMVLSKRMKADKLLSYLLAQFAGAFLAGAVLYGLLAPTISAYELAHGIVRGTEASIDTARMFGEFYPNPGDSMAVVSMPLAMVAEGFGTFLLVMFIFALTEGCNAPLTQAGLNPARDFGPRLVSWLAGWGEVAFPDACCGGFFFVYILAPILGGAVAAYALTYVIEPLIKQGDGSCECEK